jgi:hypothetical protein
MEWGIPLQFDWNPERDEFQRLFLVSSWLSLSIPLASWLPASCSQLVSYEIHMISPNPNMSHSRHGRLLSRLCGDPLQRHDAWVCQNGMV